MFIHQPPGDTFEMPCGCCAWRLGPATGVKLCWQHYVEHETGDTFRGDCSCLKCRAQRRGIDALSCVLELYDQHAAGRRPLLPTEIPADYDVAVCACLWVKSGEAWSIAKPCRSHSTDQVRALLEKERSAVPAPDAKPEDHVLTCPCAACRYLRGETTTG